MESLCLSSLFIGENCVTTQGCGYVRLAGSVQAIIETERRPAPITPPPPLRSNFGLFGKFEDYCRWILGFTLTLHSTPQVVLALFEFISGMPRTSPHQLALSPEPLEPQVTERFPRMFSGEDGGLFNIGPGSWIPWGG